MRRHTTIKTSASHSLTHRKLQSSFRLSFWFNHFCEVLYPLLLLCTQKSKDWCKSGIWWFSLCVHVLLWLHSGQNSSIFQHSPARAYQPSWYGGTATLLITFITGCMSQADENSFKQVPEQSFATTGPLEWGQSALALLCSSKRSHPPSKDPSAAAWRMLLLGERGAGIYSRTHP